MIYQPQQSVLKPHAGQRQTACMRYISAPQRSQSVFSSAGCTRTGEIGLGGGAGDGGSDIRRLWHDRLMPFEDQRSAMVRSQIEARGITDPRVLDAMRRVPRDRFVPAPLAHAAYADQALAIGTGQTISQPYMVAAMTAALALAGPERVLEVGTGSGYQAAILAELARTVVTIERHADLAAEAERRLRALGYANVTVVVGDGTAGYEPGAPYDAIIVTAGAPRIPPPLQAQLADGGRLVIPVGSSMGQELRVVRRAGDRWVETVGDACVFVPLIGAHGWSS